jgi:hypothetical protein
MNKYKTAVCVSSANIYNSIKITLKLLSIQSYAEIKKLKHEIMDKKEEN